MKPTKEQLKTLYGISDNDFEILTMNTLPTHQELMKEGAKLKKLGWRDGFEIWIKSDILTKIISAVIFIDGFCGGVEKICYGAEFVYTKREVMVQYASDFYDYSKDQSEKLLVCIGDTLTLEDIEEQRTTGIQGILPSGTEFYPLSTTYQSKA